jgi:hypothetical protein
MFGFHKIYSEKYILRYIPYRSRIYLLENEQLSKNNCLISQHSLL